MDPLGGIPRYWTIIFNTKNDSVQWLSQMIGYSQESSKIKVKDNQLKITQITVTQNYSVLIAQFYSLLKVTHCSSAQFYSVLKWKWK